MQESNNFGNKGLIRFLISRVPEFKDISSQLEEESAYLHFGYFAVFLIETIEEGKNEELINSAFDLLNDLVNLDDININTMLSVEVFELLADNKKSFLLSKEKLEGSAFKLLEKVSKFLETGLMPDF